MLSLKEYEELQMLALVCADKMVTLTPTEAREFLKRVLEARVPFRDRGEFLDLLEEEVEKRQPPHDNR